MIPHPVALLFYYKAGENGRLQDDKALSAT